MTGPNQAIESDFKSGAVFTTLQPHRFLNLVMASVRKHHSGRTHLRVAETPKAD